MNEICFVIAVLLPYRGFVFLCVFVVVCKCSLLLLPLTMPRSILCTQPEFGKHVMCAWTIAHSSPLSDSGSQRENLIHPRLLSPASDYWNLPLLLPSLTKC